LVDYYSYKITLYLYAVNTLGYWKLNRKEGRLACTSRPHPREESGERYKET
jgi:hypothetical protein